MQRARGLSRLPLLKLLRQSAKPLTAAKAAPITPSLPIEEEKTPYYDPARFYPARLGEVLGDRYQIATKLGYGTHSTVWLARDLYQWRWAPEHYVVLKVNALDRGGQTTSGNELDCTTLVTEADDQHEGWHFVRKLEDSFVVRGALGDHVCLVFQALREPLWLLRSRFEGNVIPASLLKIMVRMMLHALEYLHERCNLIHADLKPDNIMVRLEDESVLHKDAQEEFLQPLPQKQCPDRVIYLSRNNYGQPSSVPGLVAITDFGDAVAGRGPHYGCIQAEPYRAPEVILDAGWSYSADIWSLGVMLWDLLEGSKLFETAAPVQGSYDEDLHFAYMIKLLGPTPSELLAKGKRTALFYTPSGVARFSDADIPTDFNLADTITRIDEDDKKMFVTFVGRMLRWLPEDRSTAKELLDDPWLTYKLRGLDT